jgi:predicted metal-dependent peptidase
MNKGGIYQNKSCPTLWVYRLNNKKSQSHKDEEKFVIEYNPSFTRKFSERQAQGMLMHEMLHVVLRHIDLRMPKDIEEGTTMGGELDPGEKAYVWNVACDIALNQLLKDFLQDEDDPTKHIGVFPEDFGLPEGKTAEFYFRELYKVAEEQKKAVRDLVKEIARKIKEFDSHDKWGRGGDKEERSKGGYDKDYDWDKEQEENENKGEGEEEDELSKAAREVAKELGLESGRRAGTSNETIDTIVFSRLAGVKPVPLWLRKVSHTSVHGFETVIESTRKKPNRRFGLRFPANKRVSVGNKLLVAVDVSGSISMPLYHNFMKHINELSRHAGFDIIFFNHDLVGKIIRYQKKDLKVNIGGGTSFEPVMRLWNSRHRDYDALYLFTDGEASYSTPPKRSRDVNWIIYNNPSFEAPHGKVYHMVAA